jgi:hypothetical protein
MKRLLSGALLSFAIMSANSQAASVSLLTSTPDINVGENFFVDILISNLADGALGGWDGSFLFDADTVSLIGSSLGDSVLGNQLDLSGLGTFNNTQVNAVAGTLYSVDMLDVSYDDTATLNAGQANAFSLARLQFTRLNASAIHFSFDGQFSDAEGVDLEVDNNPASIEVAPVPLPAAAWLMLSGLTTLFAFARKQRRA